MDEINDIYTAIATDGFSERTLQMINNLTNDIQYGRKDFIGFTLSEHAGLCKGGSSLIGASIVVGYARRSLTAGGNAESGEGSVPANWQIDEEQDNKMVAAKGFRDNWDGQGVNYISNRLVLEDMHPANVFIDEITGMPTCIDCIVKFVTPRNDMSNIL